MYVSFLLPYTKNADLPAGLLLFHGTKQ